MLDNSSSQLSEVICNHVLDFEELRVCLNLALWSQIQIDLKRKRILHCQNQISLVFLYEIADGINTPSNSYTNRYLDTMTKMLILELGTFGVLAEDVSPVLEKLDDISECESHLFNHPVLFALI